MYIKLPFVSEKIIDQIEHIPIPRMNLIRQKYDDKQIINIQDHLSEQFGKLSLPKEWYVGKKIAIAVGSRGIPELDRIVLWLSTRLKKLKSKPYIVPAMGSHGGATAEGQQELLAHYGITSETMGVPIVSDISAIEYGTLGNGKPLYCNAKAASADGIIIINKVKPHTDFRGDIESGLAKMAMIGLGNHLGASSFHSIPFEYFPQYLREGTEILLNKLPVLFGIGIVQNAYDKIYAIEFAPKEQFLEIDCKLQKIAKEKIASFKFSKVDILIIDEIGKNFSGFGQDPNVTGRANGYRKEFASIFNAKRVVILGVSKESEGNGVGISAGDVSTRECLLSINWEDVWINLLTSTEIQGAKMPMYGNNDKQALQMAIRGCPGTSYDSLKIVHIQNTAQLHTIQVSTPLLNEIKDRSDIEFIAGPYTLEFDKKGFLK